MSGSYLVGFEGCCGPNEYCPIHTIDNNSQNEISDYCEQKEYSPIHNELIENVETYDNYPYNRNMEDCNSDSTESTDVNSVDSYMKNSSINEEDVIKFLQVNRDFTNEYFAKYHSNNNHMYSTSSPMEYTEHKIVNSEDRRYLSRKNKNEISVEDVRPHKMRRSSYSKTHVHNKKLYKAFVCNISFAASEEEVREVFDNVGCISDFKLIDKTNEMGKIVKRFAFVTMNTQCELDKLIENTDGNRLIGRPLVVRVAEERSSSNQSYNPNNNNNKNWHTGSSHISGTIEQYPYLTGDI